MCAMPSIPRARPRGTGKQNTTQALRRLFVIRFGRADIGKIALDERMAMITEALRSDPSISDRRLARQLGVNGHLVGRVRRQLERAGEIQARD